jgi:hypothetical protein
MKDIATYVAAAIQIKGQAILPRSFPASLKRTRNALQRDSALQFVSMSQKLKLMLSPECSQIRIGSSNSPRSAIESVVGRFLTMFAKSARMRRGIAQACSQKTRTLPWALRRPEDRV